MSVLTYIIFDFNDEEMTLLVVKFFILQKMISYLQKYLRK